MLPFTSILFPLLVALLNPDTCVARIFPRQNVTLRLVTQFARGQGIGNIHSGRFGNLFYTTFDDNVLLELNPRFRRALTGSPVTTISGADSLTGIATIDATSQEFAVAGSHQNGSAIYKVNCLNSATCTVLNRTDTRATLKGLTSFPNFNFTFAADSEGGTIIRYDWNTLRDEFVVRFDDALAPPSNSTLGGINGLKYQNSYFYFTNTGKGTFNCVRVNNDTGVIITPAEVIAKVPSDVGKGASYGDFTLDNDGNAYVAVFPHSVVKITPSGNQTIWVQDERLRGPTSATISPDGKTVYIATAGTGEFGDESGGQVFAANI